MLLGNSLIWFSLVTTAAAMAFYFPGIKQGRRTPYLRQARWFVVASAVGLWAALGALWYLLLTHQYQYEYVYQYSARDMQLRYVISALWGGQQGTFLLWAGFAGLFALVLRFKAKTYEPAVQFFYMGITLFLLVMLTRATPFKLLDFVPQDGRGLNPLLQDPWMTIHPPITFFGFASLGIPAAYAMAALVKEDWDPWVARALPWTVFGVLALGVGLLLGGYWAYSILGWGGFWGWDPVENSSLVPWLLGIALIHTQLIQMRQGRYRKLNLVLSLLPFLFLTYSTFLTRSGVLADFSVHSFTDLGINAYLAAFMGIFLGGGLLLFLSKMNRVPETGRPAPVASREHFLFLGSAAFALFGILVCLGTSAPLITRLTGQSSTMQPEFYNRMGLPFIILASLFMGITPHLMWFQPGGAALWRRLRWPLVATALTAPPAILWGVHHWSHLLMLLSGAFAFFANLPVVASFVRTRWMGMGGALSHAGIGLMALGILTSTAYDQKKVVELPKNKNVDVLGYTLRYLGSRPVEAGRKNAYDVSVTQGDATHVVSPLMYFNDMMGSMMKKPAIQSFLTHDVYIAPGGVHKETVAERTQTGIELGKGESAQIHGMTVRFERFDMPGQGHGDSGGGHTQGSFGAVVQVTAAGETQTLYPGMRMSPGGIVPGDPEPIPGSDLALRLVGIDANSGRVALAVGRPPLVLEDGAYGTRDGYTIQLEGFQASTGGANHATLTANVRVTDPEGQTIELSPAIVDRRDQEREYVEAPIGSSGLNLALSAVDTQSRRAEFQLVRPPQETIWVEASLKPFIILLWFGTGLVVLGMAVSTVYRSLTKSQTQTKNSSVRERKQGAA